MRIQFPRLLLALVVLTVAAAGCKSTAPVTTGDQAAVTNAATMPIESAVQPTTDVALGAVATGPLTGTGVTELLTTTGAAGAMPVPGGARLFVIDPAQSEASYTAEEEFLQGAAEMLGVKLGNAIAVGTTTLVTGQIMVTLGGQPAIDSGEISADLSTLKSDQQRRDKKIREEWLQSSQFPLANFKVTGAEGLPADYSDGQEITFKLNGEMTVREITTPVTWDVTAKITGDTLTGTATTTVSTRDFGFDPPDMAGFLTVKDGIKLTVKLTAKAQ